MSTNLGYVALVLCFAILILALIPKHQENNPAILWLIILVSITIIVVLRVGEIVSALDLLTLYAAVITASYAVTYICAIFFYVDPAKGKDAKNESRAYEKMLKLNRRIRVLYIIPVFNDPDLVGRCIMSIYNSARYVTEWADTQIFVVNDASTDNTWKILQQYAKIPGVTLINLSKNAGKKGALTAGAYQGENWREGFEIFFKRHQRKPTKDDYDELRQCLIEAGCNPPEADIYLHCDSDSIISRQFIRAMITAFLTNPKLGAISGHCNVSLKGSRTFMTQVQVAWYFTQFRYRKAAESVFGAVFCVSGPCAGFWAHSVFHLFPGWVDDKFGRGIYRGATDRKLTLLVLQAGHEVGYSSSAIAWTTVPSTIDQARKQWTRWKQNYWRMLVPVLRFAWRTHPVAAFLTYSRVFITLFAPIMITYHLTLIFTGQFSAVLYYLIGITTMGLIMGVGFSIFYPGHARYAFLRPVMSLISAFWGSTLTIRALVLTLQGSFIWRETSKTKKRRFLGIPLTFELVALFLILIFVLLYRIATAIYRMLVH